MANGIRTGNPRGFSKGRRSKFRVGSRVRQTPEESRRIYRPKRRGNNNKDEDNNPKNLNDKNQHSTSLDLNIPRNKVWGVRAWGYRTCTFQSCAKSISSRNYQE